MKGCHWWVASARSIRLTVQHHSARMSSEAAQRSPSCLCLSHAMLKCCSAGMQQIPQVHSSSVYETWQSGRRQLLQLETQTRRMSLQLQHQLWNIKYIFCTRSINCFRLGLLGRGNLFFWRISQNCWISHISSSIRVCLGEKPWENVGCSCVFLCLTGWGGNWIDSALIVVILYEEFDRAETIS